MSDHKYSNVGRMGLLSIIDQLEETNAELKAQLRGLVGAVILKGWKCPSCEAFNGEEKEMRFWCRCCGTEKPAPIS